MKNLCDVASKLFMKHVIAINEIEELRRKD
jgi:hypothetical protein